MNSSTRRLAAKQIWLLAGMFVLPLLLMVGKLPFLGTSEFLMRNFSLLDLPASMQVRVSHILFVPLGAILVVFFRVTLGVRVLGPFRSILLALAFLATGLALGLVFLVVTVAIVGTLGPIIKRMRVPYFGRISAMLSAVTLIVVVGMLSSTWLDRYALRHVAYFPLVVLTLISDAVVKTMAREGVRSALWRSLMTALVAVFLTLLAAIPGLRQLLLQYPELVSAQTGCIVLIGKYMKWHCLEWLNPKVVKRDFWTTKPVHQGLATQPPSAAAFQMARPHNGPCIPSETSNGEA